MSDNRKGVGRPRRLGESQQEREGEPGNTVPFGPDRSNTANMLPPARQRRRVAADAFTLTSTVVVSPQQPPDNQQPTLTLGSVPPLSGQGTLGADATILPKKSRSRHGETTRLVIRDRQQLIATSTLIISALQEALDYDPKRHHNLPAPALHIDDAPYLSDIRALIAELRRLNELLQKSRPQKGEPKHTIIEVRTHINLFLKNYVPLFAKGTACLTVAAMAGLLHAAGVEQNIVVGILTAANLISGGSRRR
jgi:hypothetical protein